MLRDFRDVIASHFFHSSLEKKYNEKDTCVIWELFYPYFLNIINFNKLECNKCVVYYEDLVSDFLNHIKKPIFIFNLEYDEKKVKKYNEMKKENFKKIKEWYGRGIEDNNFIGKYQNMNFEKSFWDYFINKMKEKDLIIFEKFMKRYDF